MTEERPGNELLAALNVWLHAEQSAYDIAYKQDNLNATVKGVALAELQAAQHNLLQGLQTVGVKGDIEILLLAEKLIIPV